MARGFGSYQSYTLQRQRREFLKRLALVVFTVYLTSLVLDDMLLQLLRLETASMEPSVRSGEVVVAFPLAYQIRLPFVPWTFPGLRSPQRGDLVLVRPPYVDELWPPAKFLRDLVQFFTLGRVEPFPPTSPAVDRVQLRRLVALPGDTLVFRGGVAYVKPAGEEFFLSEFEVARQAYEIFRPPSPEGWEASDPLSGEGMERKLGEGEYWVLADNRAGEDSRVWGPVSRDHLEALIWLVVWPLERLSLR